MRLFRNKRGQFIVIAALLISILTFSLVFSIFQTNNQRQELNYRPVQELVLGITSDLERALDHAANISSHIYSSTANITQAREMGTRFMNGTWTPSILTVYAVAGLNMTLLDGSPEFNFDGWDTNTGWSLASAYFSLDAPSYGFEGWVGHSQKRITLKLDPILPNPNQFERNDSDKVEFSLTQSIGEMESNGEDEIPVPNLDESDLSVKVYNIGSAWIDATVKDLTYLGGGHYSATIKPGLHPVFLGVNVTAETPNEGIIVEASNFNSNPQVTVKLQSQLMGSPNPTNRGQIQFGSLPPAALPSSIDTQLGTYIVKYFPENGSILDHWELNGVTESSTNPTLIPVQASCTITAFYKPGSTPPPPNQKYTVTLNSRASDGSSQNLGTIAFGSNNYFLPNTISNVQPLDYSLGYSTYNLTYVFQSWNATGNVFPWNSTASSTMATVVGDGTITAVYGRSPIIGNGNTLYVDAGYVLSPDRNLSDKWYRGPSQGNHLPSTASTGQNKQIFSAESQPTTNLYVISYATIIAYVRPSPPDSAKTVTLELGFNYQGTYYKLGEGSYLANEQGVYTLTLGVTSGHWTEQYGPGVIPIGSVIKLTITVEFTVGNGFFFVLYGQDQESRIEFG